MYRRIKPLLALLLACLIGLSPIQAAWSGVLFADDSSSAGSSMHEHPMMSHAAGGMASGHASHACDRCDTADCCGGGGCQLGHCAVCVVSALLPVLLLPEHKVASVYSDGLSFSLPRRAPSPFYRPPRG